MEMKRLYGTGIEASSINEGDQLLTGGSFMGQLNLSLTIDASEFEEFFKKVEADQKSIKLPELGRWLQSAGIDIDPELFSHFHAFNGILRKEFSLATDAEGQTARNQAYGEETTHLSALAQNGCMMCAEVATLAQIYFQRAGIDSKYVGGEVMNPGQEFSDPHSYNIVYNQGKTYIFDATVPVETSAGAMPRFYDVPEKLYDQWYGAAQKDQAFMMLYDGISKNPRVYGISDSGCSVNESSIYHGATPVIPAQNVR